MTTTVSSVTSHFPSAEDGFTTTLSSTISAGATTVGLNSVAGYANGEVAVMVVAPTVASEKQVFTGIVDTSGIQLTGVKWTTGTNQTHAAGTTVVDYATATHISMMSKGLLVEHTQAGAHAAVTATSVASAGAVSGTSITGSSFVSGSTRLDTGWFPGSSTWVYASSTTFTVSATEAAFMSVGTKIWLTQTTSKYFYVTGVSGTTITVTGGTDYTVANAAITAPYYSNAATPFGFPQWFNYTPTYTNFTLGNGTVVASFQQLGKTIHTKFLITLGSTSSVTGGGVAISLPVTSSSTAYRAFVTPIGVGGAYDSGGLLYHGEVFWGSTTTVRVRIFETSSTYGTVGDITSTVPFTFGTDDQIYASFTYEAA